MIPKNALVSERDRELRGAPGVADRGSTLTGARTSVQIWSLPINDGELKITIEGETPAWLPPTVEKLAHILTMEPGWDSYGAEKIEPGCVVSAIMIALEVMRDDTPAPTVVPTSCGGVQLEWHTGGIDLEIEIRSSSVIFASYEDTSGVSWEERVFDFSRIQRGLQEMALS